MSVWLYMTCLDHDPPLLADDESGQHLSDLPEIREAIANRDALVKAHELGAHLDGYFLAHSVRFLAKHRRCKLGITDEYGQTYPTTDLLARYVARHACEVHAETAGCPHLTPTWDDAADCGLWAELGQTPATPREMLIPLERGTHDRRRRG